MLIRTRAPLMYMIKRKSSKIGLEKGFYVRSSFICQEIKLLNTLKSEQLVNLTF